MSHPQHGYRALIAEFIDNPYDRRVYRTYGRRMMRRLVARCIQCHFADVDRVRIRRMHTTYGRRTR